ncbi:hypothetical protein [Paenibacillus bouchesdurhonensis]|uniref:hypothetical protein n=1 Tax=Paenibacillus bouchesdurhonensis TaxID=1870990 RepID=UPI000DA631E7|nr:hypothetical protein [Paenibacillus bouchesdurhonensis]
MNLDEQSKWFRRLEWLVLIIFMLTVAANIFVTIERSKLNNQQRHVIGQLEVVVEQYDDIIAELNQNLNRLKGR